MPMKKISLAALILFFAFSLSAQTKETDKFKNMKMLKSEQEEEVKIEIRKPDNASLKPRKSTDFENSAEMKIVEKLKNSNKMLY